MGKNICVYCSSSNAVDKIYFDEATKLGTEIAKRGYGLVYGGTNVGLMGEVAKSAFLNGGRVIGITPEKINEFGIALEYDIETIITKTMRERKEQMEINSDYFITMPGGFGTLEEISEMIVSKQLGYHNKALIFFNINGYYDHLFEYFEKFYENKFAKEWCKELYYSATSVEEIFEYIENYKITEVPSECKDKYFFTR